MIKITAIDEFILNKIRSLRPKKKKVTFSISEVSKQSLALWCKKNNVTESDAVEALIWKLTADFMSDGAPPIKKSTVDFIRNGNLPDL